LIMLDWWSARRRGRAGDDGVPVVADGVVNGA
jgi:hypothetical protein